MGPRDHDDDDALRASLNELIAAEFITPEDAGYAIAVKVRDGEPLTVAEQEVFDVDLRPVVESFDQARSAGEGSE